jgi:hypothetical protein
MFKMLDPRIFPWILIVLDIFAAIAYGIALDWRRSIYWLAAAVLTIMVTV